MVFSRNLKRRVKPSNTLSGEMAKLLENQKESKKNLANSETFFANFLIGAKTRRRIVEPVKPQPEVAYQSTSVWHS